MSFSAIGDLASNMMRNQANIQAKRNIERFSQELTTGLTSDISGALKNDMALQMDWEHTISSAQIREKTLAEAIVKVQAKQSVIGLIGQSILSLASDLNLITSAGPSTEKNALAERTNDTLRQVFSQLNTQASGTFLFSGASSDAPAMASFDEIIGSLNVAVTGAMTASDLKQRVQDWMDDPIAGFSAVVYLGSNEESSPIRVSETTLIREPLKANDDAFRKAIQELLLTSVALDETHGFATTTQAAVLASSADGLRTAELSLVDRSARLGQVESSLSNAKVRASAEISTAEIIRADRLGVDQFEVASQFQRAEQQLEKIYMLTSRTAQMSLLEYLQ